jgi:hypothetical protein
VLLAAVLAGCGGPSRVGSAMVVGDRSVDLASVQAAIDGALLHRADLNAQASQEIGNTDIARYVVTRQVNHELLTAAAARAGVSVPEDAVDAALADTTDQNLQVDRLLFDGAQLRERARDQELAVALAQRYVDGLQVTVDAAAATTEADADAKARALAAGGPDADRVLADRAAAAPGQVTRAATDPESATNPEYGVPAGSVVKYQPSPGQGYWLVLRVTDRRLDAPPAQVQQAASTIDRATLAVIGRRIAQAEAAPLDLNPRFGVWDPVRMAVVAPGQEAGTVLTP